MIGLIDFFIKSFVVLSFNFAVKKKILVNSRTHHQVQKRPFSANLFGAEFNNPQVQSTQLKIQLEVFESMNLKYHSQPK